MNHRNIYNIIYNVAGGFSFLNMPAKEPQNSVWRVLETLLRRSAPLFVLAFAIRAGMLLYGLWQDATSESFFIDF